MTMINFEELDVLTAKKRQKEKCECEWEQLGMKNGAALSELACVERKKIELFL